MFLGSQLIEQQVCVPMAGQMLMAALLPWMAYPSILTSQILREAQAVLEKINNLKGITMAEVPFTSHEFPTAHLSVRIYCLIHSWSGNHESVVAWLRQLSLGPECSLVLGAFLIHESSPAPVLSASLTALLALVKTSPQLGTSVLTWLLYRLAREKCPNNQLELLKTLPLLGGQKVRVTLI